MRTRIPPDPADSPPPPPPAPGDFDGDLVLDLIIVATSAAASSYHLYASWGSTSNEEWQLASPKEFLVGADGKKIERQPTVLDYDGNTVPDLLVQKEDDGKIYRVKIDGFVYIL